MDPHQTQVLQHLESFKDAYSKKDYGACTDLLSCLNGILIEKTSQRRVDLSKTVAGIEEKGQTENNKLEDFSKIPFDKDYIDAYPYGDMQAVGYGKDGLYGIFSDVKSDEDIDENNGNIDENNHDQEQLEEMQEPARRSQRIPTPTTRVSSHMCIRSSYLHT